MYTVLQEFMEASMYRILKNVGSCLRIESYGNIGRRQTT
jgi:hypothetical protein